MYTMYVDDPITEVMVQQLEQTPRPKIQAAHNLSHLTLVGLSISAFQHKPDQALHRAPTSDDLKT